MTSASDQRASRDRALVAIVLTEIVYPAVADPSRILLAVDDVTRRWRQHLYRLAANNLGHRLLEYESVTALRRFVDDYTAAVEGYQDLPDDMRAEAWRSHIARLAPADPPCRRDAVRAVARISNG